MLSLTRPLLTNAGPSRSIVISSERLRKRLYSTNTQHPVPLIINGARRPAENNATFPVTNPASQSQTGASSAASPADCIAAADAANAAFSAWEKTPPAARRDVFLRAADVLARPEWRDRVVGTMSAEVDASKFWAEFNWMEAIDALRTTAGLVGELAGRAYASTIVPGAQVLEQKRAMGVMCVSSCAC